MSRTTNEIVSQCDAGLISIAEARCAFSWVMKRARLYECDGLAEYKRAAKARRALMAL